eukprot:gene240-4486_t
MIEEGEEPKPFPKSRKELTKKKYIRVIEQEDEPAPPKYDVLGESTVFESKLQPVDLDLMVYQIQKKAKNLATIRRLILYVPFVIFITMWMFFGFEIETGYWMQHGIRQQILWKPFPYGGANSLETEKPPGAPDLTTFHTFQKQDVNSPLDYYRWLKGVVIPALFVEKSLNGTQLPRNQLGYSISQIKNIGALRIRQHRIKKKRTLSSDSICSPLRRFVPLLPQFDHDCYEDISTGTIDTAPFGPNNTYTYKTCDQNGGGYTYRGRKLSFDCGAHTLFLPFNTSRADALKFVDDLIANKWIDKQTKSQVVEWFGYNNNINFFTSSKFAVEFTRGGGLISTWEIDAFRIQPFREALNIVYFAVCMLAPLFLLISIFVWILDLFNEFKYGTGWHFFLDSELKFPWVNLMNLAEVINLGLIIVSFGIRFYLFFREFAPFDMINVFNSTIPWPTRLEEARNLTIYDNAIVGTGVILSYFRIFKFFSLNDRLNLISETVQRAASNLGSVVLTQILSLFAFAVCGWIIFGNDIDDYKDLLSALSALLRSLIGENQSFDDYFAESRILMPIFYISFIFLNFLIVINMIFGVIETGFNDSVVNVLDKSMLFDVKRTARTFLDYGKKLLFLERGLNHKKDVKYKINQGDDELVKKLKKYQQQHGTTTINAEDIRNALKGGGEDTINRIMYRYDIDGDGTIDIRELEMASTHRDEEEAKKRQEAAALKNVGKIQSMLSKKQKKNIDDLPVEKNVDDYVKSVDGAVDELLYLLAEEVGEEEFVKAQYDSDEEYEEINMDEEIKVEEITSASDEGSPKRTSPKRNSPVKVEEEKKETGDGIAEIEQTPTNEEVIDLNN